MGDQGRFLSTLVAGFEIVHLVNQLSSVPPVSVYATYGVLGGAILHRIQTCAFDAIALTCLAIWLVKDVGNGKLKTVAAGTQAHDIKERETGAC